MKNLNILIVDDELTIRDALKRALSNLPLNIETANNGDDALKKIEVTKPDILISDLRMPRMGGLELLVQVKKLYADVQFIVITGHATVEDAIKAMKNGAYDFITKPFKRHEIISIVNRAMEKVNLVTENIQLKNKIKKKEKESYDWGKSKEFNELLQKSVQAAKSEANILILGESGTGKEVLADYIHENSSRSEAPFIKVNCAAIPDTLLESELFGHKKGSYTGAVKDAPGQFLEANKGTIFLDEIGEVPLAMQVKLLRVLQSGEINPLGGKTIKTDVRILAATNQDLRKKVKDGSFREDLFFRLNVIPLVVPPLRERPEDLKSLTSFFVRKFCKKNRKTNLILSPEALEAIENYSWTGNVRELENAIERAVILCSGDKINLSDLPPELSDAHNDTEGGLHISGNMTMEEIEQYVIKRALKKFNGNKNAVADALGISLRTIYRKLDDMEKVH